MEKEEKGRKMVEMEKNGGKLKQMEEIDVNMRRCWISRDRYDNVGYITRKTGLAMKN